MLVIGVMSNISKCINIVQDVLFIVKAVDENDLIFFMVTVNWKQ